jgi:hypothetical protein
MSTKGIHPPLTAITDPKYGLSCTISVGKLVSYKENIKMIAKMVTRAETILEALLRYETLGIENLLEIIINTLIKKPIQQPFWKSRLLNTSRIISF